MVIFIDIMRLPFGYCLLAAWIIPKMEFLTAKNLGFKMRKNKTEGIYKNNSGVFEVVAGKYSWFFRDEKQAKQKWASLINAGIALSAGPVAIIPRAPRPQLAA